MQNYIWFMSWSICHDLDMAFLLEAWLQRAGVETVCDTVLEAGCARRCPILMVSLRRRCHKGKSCLWVLASHHSVAALSLPVFPVTGGWTEATQYENLRLPNCKRRESFYLFHEFAVLKYFLLLNEESLETEKNTSVSKVTQNFNH